MQIGGRLEVYYGLYTIDDFLARFRCSSDSASVKGQVCTFLNQENVKETCVAVIGDRSAPRVYVRYTDCSNELEEDMMPMQLRSGQGTDKFSWLVGEEVKFRGPVLLEANRLKYKSYPELKIICEQIEVVRRKQEVHDALHGAGAGTPRGSAQEAAQGVQPAVSEFPSWMAPSPAAPEKQHKQAKKLRTEPPVRQGVPPEPREPRSHQSPPRAATSSRPRPATASAVQLFGSAASTGEKRGSSVASTSCGGYTVTWYHGQLGGFQSTFAF